MERDARVYVAGHRGLAGSAIVRRLEAGGFHNLLLKTRAELDLTRQEAIEAFFAVERPAYVFLAAAKVGGILANSTRGAEFIRENLLIQTNVIDAAWRHGARKLLFLGSSCIYPKFARQPITESELLAGPLEPTNQPYAVAKIAGVEMCKAYRAQYGFDAISVMPANLYGPGDHFDGDGTHVLAALIHRLHQAKAAQASQTVVWGSGAPRREFLHVDDLADAALFLMRTYTSADLVNVGTGEDISIRDLALMIADITGYAGELVQDTSRPDGTPRKLLDVSRLRALGWSARISLREGIEQTYRWYVGQNSRTGAPGADLGFRATRLSTHL
jgi:GDP-L-fucose synthase